MGPSGKYAKRDDEDDNVFKSTLKSYVDPRNQRVYEDTRDKVALVRKGEYTTASGEKKDVKDITKDPKGFFGDKDKDKADLSQQIVATSITGKKLTWDDYAKQEYQPYRMSSEMAQDYFTYKKKEDLREKSEKQHYFESIFNPV